MLREFTGNAPETSLLLVEDEESSRISLGRMLRLKFPEVMVYTAENGREGLDLYRRHRPDLVITDINMPEMSGIEMAQEIRSQYPQAELIVLSAHSDTDHIVDAAESGVTNYVFKPIDQHKLFAAVSRSLQRPRFDPAPCDACQPPVRRSEVLDSFPD